MRQIHTIGHSTRSLQELIQILRGFEISALIDVRRYPGSRRLPHFSSASLRDALAENAIDYRHAESLGGRRKPAPDSPNTFWRNDSFRAYADYMATTEFQESIDHLLTIPGRPAVMCAEAVPWRCHRNLIADELTRRGVDVVHILGIGSSKIHEMNPAAQEMGTHLVYRDVDPAGQESLF